MNHPGCLVLAAGFHRRFGAPKLLQPLWDDRALIQHTLSNIQASGLEMAVVYRPDDEDVFNIVSSFNAIAVENIESAQGMGQSLACGVQATEHWAGWLICLADMPVISANSYKQVAMALTQNSIVVPTYQNRVGHPKGFDRRYFSELQSLTGDMGARQLLSQYKAQIHSLTLDDPGILVDVDCFSDLSYVNQLLQPG